MSTHIPAMSPGAAEPVTVADLEGYFHDAARPRERWRVGAEFEKIGVARDSGRQLIYDVPGGIRDTLAGLVARFEWESFYEGVFLTALLRDGATVSIEPGGQVELSTAPAVHVGQIAAALELAALAAEGLRRQAVERGHPDERRYLEPVFAVLKRGLSPGAQFMAASSDGAAPTNMIDWFEC